MADLTVLTKQLADGPVEARAAAAEQFAQMGEAARPAAIALVRATGDEESVRSWAVAALEEMGPPDLECLPQFEELCGDDRELVAYWSITLLGRMGPAAVEAETALARALSASPHASVRQRAAWALGKLGTLAPTTMDLLKRASQDGDARLANLAARVLAAAG